MECQSATQLGLEPKSHQGRGVAPPWRARWATYDLPKTPSRWARCLARLDFEQVRGAAQAALQVSRVVYDSMRDADVGGELRCLI